MSVHERHSTRARVGVYWAWNLSESGIRCRLLAKPAIRPGRGTPGQRPFAAGKKKRPQ